MQIPLKVLANKTNLIVPLKNSPGYYPAEVAHSTVLGATAEKELVLVDARLARP